MSTYTRYNFISPERVYARVKEELKSYFDTGIIDDLLFPIYTEDLLREFGKAAYKIMEVPIQIENYQGRLPDNFYAIREVWGCTNVVSNPIQDTRVEYSQITTRVTPLTDRCEDCIEKDVKVTFKTTGQLILSYTYSMLLTPGNINAIGHCTSNCPNLYSSSPDSFDIRDGKIIVNFPKGVVHLVYYTIENDDNENQLIPDIIQFTKLLEYYIKYKCFEQIFNNTTDESFNQVRIKKDEYKALYDEQFVTCRINLRMQDIYGVVNSIKKQKHRFDEYERQMGGRINTTRYRR